MPCMCAACQAAVKPGRRFLKMVRSALEKVKEPRGKAKRHPKLQIWVWAMARTKAKREKGVVLRHIFRNALHQAATLTTAQRSEAKLKKIRKRIAKSLMIGICPNCHLDSAQCGCWQCAECHDWHVRDDDRCDVCQRCTDCCECVTCPHCSRHVLADRICSDCGRCSMHGCCRCAEERRRRLPFREVLGGRLTFHGEPTDRFPRFVGTEIECGATRNNFAPLKKAQEKWNMANHRDGSICLDSGMEVCTAPARGTAFEVQVEEACAALRECGATVNSSCGLHVHVEAKDLTAKDVLGLVRLYHMVEPALYQIVSPSRRNGTYSREWGQHFKENGVFDLRNGREKRAEALEKALYGSEANVKSMKANPRKHDSRYHGLNLNALLLYGTVEFRLHQGTVNARKIIMWSAVCAAMVEYATKHSEKEITWLTEKPMEVLKKVAGDPEVVEWIEARQAYFKTKDRLRTGPAGEKNLEPKELSEES